MKRLKFFTLISFFLFCLNPSEARLIDAPEREAEVKAEQALFQDLTTQRKQDPHVLRTIEESEKLRLQQRAASEGINRQQTILREELQTEQERLASEQRTLESAVDERHSKELQALQEKKAALEAAFETRVRPLRERISAAYAQFIQFKRDYPKLYTSEDSRDYAMNTGMVESEISDIQAREFPDLSKVQQQLKELEAKVYHEKTRIQDDFRDRFKAAEVATQSKILALDEVLRGTLTPFEARLQELAAQRQAFETPYTVALGEMFPQQLILRSLMDNRRGELERKAGADS